MSGTLFQDNRKSLQEKSIILIYRLSMAILKETGMEKSIPIKINQSI